MAEEFKASPPEFNLYWSDENGNIDLKDRENSSGLWKKEKNGRTYWSGKNKATGRRFLMFPNQKKNEDPDW